MVLLPADRFDLLTEDLARPEVDGWQLLQARQELDTTVLPRLRELAAQDMPVSKYEWSAAKAAAQTVHVIEKNLLR